MQPERFDQRQTAFYRRKQAASDAAAAAPEAGQPGPGGEIPDALQRVFFGDVRRGNCVNELLASAVDGPVRPVMTPFASPAAAAEHVRDVARLFGADLAGVARAEPGYVYSHSGHENGAAADLAGQPIELAHQYAVVMGFSMDYGRVLGSPSFIDAAEVGKGYIRAAVAAVSLAAYIRELGYPARAHVVRNEQVFQVPLAVAAGLGELGRNGLLLTARFGPRLRLSSVTTDLPLEPDGPADLGVKRFCEACLKCAKACPSQSVPHGATSVVRGVDKWKVDGDTCLEFWHASPDYWCNCNNCIKVCPWNKPDTWWHRLAAWSARRLPWAARPLVWLDDLLWGKNPRPHVRWLWYDNRRPGPWVKRGD